MKYLIGVDEVGLGALAGPALVVAVAVTEDWKPPQGLRDSKKMTFTQRMRIVENLPVDITFVKRWVPVHVIDEINPHKAALRGILQAIAFLFAELEVGAAECDIVVDGSYKIDIAGVRVEPKADDLYPVVSLASVIAKVTRDKYMAQTLHPAHPKYGFKRHMGYPTREHRIALEKHGPIPGVHRISYEPVKKAMR